MQRRFSRCRPVRSSSASPKPFSFSSKGSNDSGSRASGASGTAKTNVAVANKPVKSSLKPKVPTPLAPSFSHTSPKLLAYDLFFSQHRPLLEFSVPLEERKTVRKVSGVDYSTFNNVFMDHQEIVNTGMIEVADLDDNGDPISAPYFVHPNEIQVADDTNFVGKRGGTISDDFGDKLPHLSQSEIQFNQLQFPENELGFDRDPYEEFLIGEPDGGPNQAEVSKYLAEHQPFMTPQAPAPTQPEELDYERERIKFDAQTEASLRFLQPFSNSFRSPSTKETEERSDRIWRLMNLRLSPEDSHQVAQDYLNNAVLSHQYQSLDEYVRHGGDVLEKALQHYKDEVKDHSVLSENEQSVDIPLAWRKRQTKLWSGKDWVLVDASNLERLLRNERPTFHHEEEEPEAKLASSFRRRKPTNPKRRR